MLLQFHHREWEPLLFGSFGLRWFSISESEDIAVRDDFSVDTGNDGHAVDGDQHDENRANKIKRVIHENTNPRHVRAK